MNRVEQEEKLLLSLFSPELTINHCKDRVPPSLFLTIGNKQFLGGYYESHKQFGLTEVYVHVYALTLDLKLS